jgi:Glyoxalase superfamily protein
VALVDERLLRGPLVLHLSSHHDDGTPGDVVLVEVTGIKELHEELQPRTTGS